MTVRPTLRIVREESNGNMWATLLKAEGISDLKTYMTASSETSEFGWRYGITTDFRKHREIKFCIIQVDLTDITAHANPDAFKLHFSCTFGDSSTLNGEFDETSKLLPPLQSYGISVEGQVGLIHKINTISTANDGFLVLVTARVDGNLVAAHEAFHQWVETAPGKIEATDLATDILVKSISSGAFAHTQFNAFTRRRKERDCQRLSHPRPLYAASVALEGLKAYGVGDLDDIDQTSWRALVSDSSCERDFLDVSDEYEEDSDLDLDEEAVIEEVSQDVASISVSGDTASVGSSAYSKVTYGEIGAAASPHAARKFVVTGAAYKTWKTFLVYVYTGKIKFSTLTSRKSGNSKDTDTSDEQFYGSQCSPKSMYRLAHKLGIEPLKRLAFEAIRSNIIIENIL
ncbi:hypothetical protein CONPUDRAFT_163850, partial [Coniophora puteana RWD-64-598 SS2]